MTATIVTIPTAAAFWERYREAYLAWSDDRTPARLAAAHAARMRWQTVLLRECTARRGAA